MDKYLESQLRQRSTKFEGVSIKQYTFKSFYDCLFLYRLKRQLENRLKQLQEKYSKKKISRKTLIQLFNSIISYLIDTEIKLYSNSLTLDHKRNNFVYKIQKVLQCNYCKYLTAILNPKKHILLLSEFKKIKFLFFITHPITFFKIKSNAIIIDDSYNDLLMEILIFNYPEMFQKKDNDKDNDNDLPIESKSDEQIKNGYIEILSVLAKRFSKNEIDNFYMDEIKILISNIEKEKYIDYMNTHFAGVRYSTISQASFKNDDNGTKRNAELQKIVDTLIQNATGKQAEKPKSELMSKMEIEAMKVLEKLEKNKVPSL